MRYHNVWKPGQANEEFWKEVLVGRKIALVNFMTYTKNGKGHRVVKNLVLDNGEKIIFHPPGEINPTPFLIQQTELECLYDRARELVGREVEVEKTTDGKFIAIHLDYTKGPPPQGLTEKEALEEFILCMEKRELSSLHQKDIVEAEDDTDRPGDG